MSIFCAQRGVSNTDDAYTFASQINSHLPENTGRVEHHNGTTVLTGDNNFTGDAIIDGGTLVVDGTIENAVTTVANGGTLGGLGHRGKRSGRTGKPPVR